MTRPAAPAAWIAAALILGWAWSAQAAPTLDDQVYAIAKELMCPVCGGQTVAESGAQLAAQMRDVIRARLQQGQTREEIIDYFVAQFGEGILAAPPRRGGGLLVWLVPPVALGIGAIVLRRFVRRSLPRGRPALRPPTPDEAAQIARELHELD